MRAPTCLLALACAACGPRTARPVTDEVPWAASGIDWTTPPATRELPWTPPPVATATLANGIRLVVVENHRLPLVSLVVIHGAAGSREDRAQPGVAALAIEALAPPEPRVTAHIATDYATHELVTTSAQLPRALAALAGTTTHGIDDETRIAAARTQRLAQLAQTRALTRRIAAQVFDRVVFGAHPYGQPAAGTETSVAALTPPDVGAFWARAYRPDAMTVVAAGATTLAELRTHVDAAFGRWRAPGGALVEPPALPAYAPQLAYVDVPGATETNVIVGRRAPGTRDPAALAADVATTIVGGGIDGRLDRELHARLALTFGASASFWRGSAGGAWAAAATFETAKTAAGVRALLAVLDEAARSGPSDRELASARRDTLAAARQLFDTTAGTARALVRLVTQARPLAHYATLGARLTALDAAGVRAALPLDQLSIVVVGDWSKLQDLADITGLRATPYTP